MPKKVSEPQEDKVPTEEAKEPRSILLLDFAGLDEVVPSTPAYQAIKRRFPTSLLTLLTRQTNVPFLSGDPTFYEVVGVSDNSKGGNPPFTETLRTIMAFRRRGYEMAVDLNGTPFNAFLLHMANVPRRFGNISDRGSRYLTDNLEVATHSHNPLLRRLSLLEKIGCTTRRRKPVIHPSPGDERYIDDLLLATGLGKKDRFMVIHPALEWNNAFPPHQMIKVIDWVAGEKPGLAVFLSGSENNRLYVEEVAHGCAVRPSVFYLGLSRFAAFVKRCDLFIGDEGIHTILAAAVETRVVGLYLQENSIRSDTAIPPMNSEILIDILKNEFSRVESSTSPKRRYYESEEFRRMRKENNLFLHTSP